MNFLPVLAIGFAVFTLALTDVHAQSQHEMNQQAFAEFDKADAELNKVYAKVLAKLDEEGKTKLKTAQRAWVAFRDAQAEMDADLMRGGSGAILLHAGSKTGTTQSRVKDLKGFLKQLEDG
jgi:uncharacterized protein YecT (DUF1311 family)